MIFSIYNTQVQRVLWLSVALGGVGVWWASRAPVEPPAPVLITDDGCPEGARWQGAAPPDGTEMWCSLPSGIRHGTYRGWYASGTLRQQGTYHHGSRAGAWETWSTDGHHRVGQQEPTSVLLNAMDYRMLRVETGTFRQGTRSQQYAFDLDHTAHTVSITRAYLLGATEVTQGMWRTVMDTDPTRTRCPGGGVGDTLPVACVSFVEAATFANRLSERDGQIPAYTIDHSNVFWNPEADGYRLPTGAEWEFAAQAGSDTLFSGTSERDKICLFANIDSYGIEGEGMGRQRWSQGECFWADGMTEPPFLCEDQSPGLAATGSYRPNQWGFFDMSGNVSEWVWDYTETYGHTPEVDPTGPGAPEPMAFGRAYSGSTRTLRGGGWDSCPRRVQNHFRSLCPSGTWYCKGPRPLAVGFRLAKSIF